MDIHRPGSPPLPPWQPLGELVSSPDALAARIGEVRERLAAAAGAAAALLADPALNGTYQGRPLHGFRRRNCCLIYRLSPERSAYCGDCVLDK